MAKVVFSSELQKLTGEPHTVVTARVFKDIVTELTEKYARLDEDSLLAMAVAIDGEIIHQPYLEKVDEGSELHLLYRISGG